MASAACHSALAGSMLLLPCAAIGWQHGMRSTLGALASTPLLHVPQRFASTSSGQGSGKAREPPDHKLRLIPFSLTATQASGEP